METLEVVAAYTLTADGQRHDVAPDRIYTRKLLQRHGAAVCRPQSARHRVLQPGAGIARGV